MSPSQEQIRQAEQLTQRYFERILSNDEGLELLRLWGEYPELKQSAQSLCKLEASLCFLGRLEKQPIACKSKGCWTILIEEEEPFNAKKQDDDVSLDHDELIRLASSSPSFILPNDLVAPPTTKATPSPCLSSRYKPTIWDRIFHRFVLPLVLLVAITTIYFEFHPLPTPKNVSFDPVASVDAVVNVVWPENAKPLKEGQQLESVKIRFEQGLVGLTLKNGIRLTLNGPVDFQLNSQWKTFCNQGRLSATVPGSGKGFEVATPLLNVVDLGTEFSLDVQDDQIEVHTITGSVDLTRTPKPTQKLVHGEAFQISSNGKTKRFDADAEIFFSWNKLEKRVVEDQLFRLDHWKQRYNRLNEDPNLLIHFDFEEKGKEVFNQAKQGDVGMLLGGRRSKGRWRDKGAVVFQGQNDAVRLKMSNELQSLTLIASVRIDRLERYNQTLLASRQLVPGSLYWQLDNKGAIQLSIQKVGNPIPTKYTSNDAIERTYWGSWFLLATVVDADSATVTHYVDGKPIDTFRLESGTAIHLGEAILGNAFRDDRAPVNRSFDGAFDQFFLWNRALSGKEIEDIAEDAGFSVSRGMASKSTSAKSSYVKIP